MLVDLINFSSFPWQGMYTILITVTMWYREVLTQTGNFTCFGIELVEEICGIPQGFYKMT